MIADGAARQPANGDGVLYRSCQTEWECAL
jgi:hypothetical protein